MVHMPSIAGGLSRAKRPCISPVRSRAGRSASSTRRRISSSSRRRPIPSAMCCSRRWRPGFRSSAAGSGPTRELLAAGGGITFRPGDAHALPRPSIELCGRSGARARRWRATGPRTPGRARGSGIFDDLVGEYCDVIAGAAGPSVNRRTRGDGRSPPVGCIRVGQSRHPRRAPILDVDVPRLAADLAILHVVLPRPPDGSSAISFAAPQYGQETTVSSSACPLAISASSGSPAAGHSLAAISRGSVAPSFAVVSAPLLFRVCAASFGVESLAHGGGGGTGRPPPLRDDERVGDDRGQPGFAALRFCRWLRESAATTRRSPSASTRVASRESTRLRWSS